MFKLKFWAVFLIFLGCAKKEDIIIKAGNVYLTKEDLKNKLGNLEPRFYYYFMTEGGKKQLIDLLEKESVFLSLAKSQGIDEKKEYINAIREYKKLQEIKFKEFQKSLVLEMYLKNLQEKELKTTDKEIKDYYNEHRDAFKNVHEYEVEHILLPTEDLAKEVLRKLKNDEDFYELAKAYSIDPASSLNGGKLGWIRKGDIDNEFESVLPNLRVNEISGIVKTKYGYHIIRKTGERIVPENYENFVKSINQKLQKEKVDAWYSKQKEKIKISINENRIVEYLSTGK